MLTYNAYISGGGWVQICNFLFNLKKFFKNIFLNTKMTQNKPLIFMIKKKFNKITVFLFEKVS